MACRWIHARHRLATTTSAQALKYGINRQQLGRHDPERLWFAGERPPDWPRPAVLQHRVGTERARPRQGQVLPERSRDGKRSTVDIHLADAAFAGAMDAGVLYCGKCVPQVASTLNVVREPNDGYWSNVWMQKPFVGTYWGGRPTEDWMFATAYAEGVPWNESYWSHERFNELLGAGPVGTQRRDLRREMYLRDAGHRGEPGWHRSSRCSQPTSVRLSATRWPRPEQIASNWRNDGHRIGERWWFA